MANWLPNLEPGLKSAWQHTFQSVFIVSALWKAINLEPRCGITVKCKLVLYMYFIAYLFWNSSLNLVCMHTRNSLWPPPLFPWSNICKGYIFVLCTCITGKRKSPFCKFDYNQAISFEEHDIFIPWHLLNTYDIIQVSAAVSLWPVWKFPS